MQGRFAQLTQDLAALAGLQDLVPQPGDDGSTWVVFELDGVEVCLLSEAAGGSGERLFSRVILGPMEPHDDAAQWGELLQANHALTGPGHAAYSRDDWTGDVVLQRAYPLDQRPHELLGLLSRQCDLARDWLAGRVDTAALARLGPVWEPAPDPSDLAKARADVESGAKAFASLCEAMGQACGVQGVAPHALDAGGATLLLEVRGIDVQLAHWPSMADTGTVVVLATIQDGEGLPPERMRDLADANAWLLREPHGAVICRRPLAGDFVLRASVSAVAAADGGHLARWVADIANAARTVRLELDAAGQDDALARPSRGAPHGSISDAAGFGAREAHWVQP